MRASLVTAAMLGIGFVLVAIPTPLAAAWMTIEQARMACRAEIPMIPPSDRGHSRGFANPNKGRLRDCIRSKRGLPAG